MAKETSFVCIAHNKCLYLTKLFLTTKHPLCFIDGSDYTGVLIVDWDWCSCMYGNPYFITGNIVFSKEKEATYGKTHLFICF